ncbi:hypothetical protein BKA56DRAFT_572969 [Ilyonectria sp. MPI-CAGE-AT-0026]|nr:hypothetical protein BKA56DRAFT_572969 [Ilyonectria sp. MPI-CAGE-AT-0026]
MHRFVSGYAGANRPIASGRRHQQWALFLQWQPRSICRVWTCQLEAFPVLLTMRTEDELSEIAPASSPIRGCRREITKYISTALLCWGAGILHSLGMLILAVDHERNTGRLE